MFQPNLFPYCQTAPTAISPKTWLKDMKNPTKHDVPHYFSAQDARSRQYAENGFIRYRFSNNNTTLEKAAMATKAIGTQNKVRAQDLWRTNNAIKDIACSEEILALLSTLYGRRGFPFQTLNFLQGSQQKAHSDTIHFSSNPAHFMCGVWVALEDVDEDNGPLIYYPGSQKLPIYTIEQIGGRDYTTHYEPFITQTLAKASYERQTAPMKKGDVFIWSANLIHGGASIINPQRTRLSQVTHYYFEDCHYITPLREQNGRDHIREIFDIDRSTYVRQTYNGKKVRPSFPVAAAARYRNWMKKPLMF